MPLILRGGRLVVEGAHGIHRVGSPVDIRIQGGVIEAISAHEPGRSLASDDIIDATGMLVVPGLINGHLHSHEAFQKGRYENMLLEVYVHYVRPTVPMSPLTVEEVYLRTMVGAIESLRGGATTVVDDVNFLPDLREDHIAAVFRAYDDSGLRAYVGVSMLDKPYFRTVPFVEEEMPPDMLADFMNQPIPSTATLLNLATDLIKR